MRRCSAWGSCRHLDLRVLCVPLRTLCFSSCMNLLFSNLQFQIRYRPPLASRGKIVCDSRNHSALRAAIELRDHKLLSSVFSVNCALFARSFALSKMSTPVFSISCELFAKNTRGGYPRNFRGTSAPSPRTASSSTHSPGITQRRRADLRVCDLRDLCLFCALCALHHKLFAFHFQLATSNCAGNSK